MKAERQPPRSLDPVPVAVCKEAQREPAEQRWDLPVGDARGRLPTPHGTSAGRCVDSDLEEARRLPDPDHLNLVQPWPVRARVGGDLVKETRRAAAPAAWAARRVPGRPSAEERGVLGEKGVAPACRQAEGCGGRAQHQDRRVERAVFGVAAAVQGVLPCGEHICGDHRVGWAKGRTLQLARARAVALDPRGRVAQPRDGGRRQNHSASLRFDERHRLRHARCGIGGPAPSR